MIGNKCRNFLHTVCTIVAICISMRFMDRLQVSLLTEKQPSVMLLWFIYTIDKYMVIWFHNLELFASGDRIVERVAPMCHW
jgi:hypothetical protein